MVYAKNFEIINAKQAMNITYKDNMMKNLHTQLTKCKTKTLTELIRKLNETLLKLQSLHYIDGWHTYGERILNEMLKRCQSRRLMRIRQYLLLPENNRKIADKY